MCNWLSQVTFNGSFDHMNIDATRCTSSCLLKFIWKNVLFDVMVIDVVVWMHWIKLDFIWEIKKKVEIDLWCTWLNFNFWNL